ncbi:ABC transporter permease subunit [Halobacillus kuroshimensis]|uniref:ABC transporter permease subunit n=1 Tax=Halobacillus kuroshimensis TaxID=302481 RepID=A0ABS3E154_9BACI|nr:MULTISPECIES: ABC transporter permease subunit [Halobacillus]MBN8237312.1 ABC transporter permease subunit [Halobacillus kuroshimensis]
MSNFFQLVKNEWMKLLHQKSTWIMMVILAVLVIGAGILFKVDAAFTNGDVPSGDNWKQELQEQNEQLMADPTAEVEYPNYGNMEENQYRIDNDLAPTAYNGWDFVRDNLGLSALVGLFAIIAGAGIVANEFRWGTIKLLLIRPITRLKILLSKYVTVLTYALAMKVFLYVFSLITGAALFGLEGFSETYVYQQNGDYQNTGIFTFSLLKYGLSFIELTIMTTFAFMIAAIFRNTSLAIGLSIFLMMAGSSIIFFLIEKEWAKFILFANTNLNQFFEGSPIIPDLTLGFSITVLAVYYIVFLLLSWVFFTKRDVAGS